MGAGYIGLEMAEALRAHDVEVTIVDLAEQVMPTLDADIAEHVLAELETQKVQVCLGQRVTSFVGPAQVRDVVRTVAAKVESRAGGAAAAENGRLRVREVVTANTIFAADIVIFGVGSRPSIKLAQDAGIALGASGAIAVDAQQRTNVPGIWAAGAVAEAQHLVIGKQTYLPLATTANKQGRVAGTNAAGGEDRFGGVVGTAVVQTFDLTIAHTGLSEKYARFLGLDATSATVKAYSRAHYMPGSEPLHVKLVYEPGTQRLLGAQIVGKDGVAGRIDVIATALHAGWTTYELAELDLCYAPPVSPVWDPVLVAANVANRRQE